MPRYFLEVSYKGTGYSGFQAQQNANSIQEEVERALEILFRRRLALTGSSRTDTGVHAHSNFFHFDFPEEIRTASLYNLNAILPAAIVTRNIYAVPAEAHCRFDAASREYAYYVYQHKDPFLEDRAYYYPYTLDAEKLAEAAAIIPRYGDFTSFSKRNTQVKSFNCVILKSSWRKEGGSWVYRVQANRFLRGMVRGLVGTMLQVGRGRADIRAFERIIESRNCARADFSVPGHGLFLDRVNYPDGLLTKIQ